MSETTESLRVADPESERRMRDIADTLADAREYATRADVSVDVHVHGLPLEVFDELGEVKFNHHEHMPEGERYLSARVTRGGCSLVLFSVHFRVAVAD